MIEHDVLVNQNKRTLNSKKKGNRGELMAKRFLKTWTRLRFERTPNSGGLFLKGDIQCLNCDFRFCVEVKNYAKDFKVQNKDGTWTSYVLKFWNQCLTDATSINKEPLLMLHYNHLKGWFIFFNLKYKEYFQLNDIYVIDGGNDFIAIKGEDLLKISYYNLIINK